ncbi:MAG: DNA polymerase III subunit delta [Verrucomicrobiota bacterium]|nr:DNA polymerase III subunit delta [Verrucomicrobiota bacterium]
MAATPRFILVCGPDDFIVGRMGKALWEQLNEGITDDFGREIVNGAAGNVSEVQNAIDRFCSAVQTMPMFGDRKVVWFKDVTFLGDSITGRAEGTATALVELQKTLANVNPLQVGVLITACPVDRRKTAFKWFNEHGDVRLAGESGKKDDTGAAVMALISEEARALGVTITPDAAAFLAGRINGNSRLAVEEMNKLATYMGDEKKPISEALVTAMVPTFGEGDFFESAEAFFSGRLDWALDAMKRHFFAGHDARPLLTNLQNRNRLLLQLRVLIDAGEIGSSINQQSLDKAARTYAHHFAGDVEKSSLNVFSQNPWYLGRLAQSARLHTLKKLISYEADFLRAFTELIERPKEPEEVMREMTIRCLG